MALQDILDAITAQADQQIADARKAHQQELTRMREQSERALATKKQETAVQKEEKKTQLRAKAEAYAQARKSSVILKKKQDLLDRAYEQALEKLTALPDEKVEPLLRWCVKQITAKGKIHPSKKHEKLLKKIAPSKQFSLEKATDAKGGFLFESTKQEQDFTFKHLVSEWLRPRTELDTSKKLFSKAA